MNIIKNTDSVNTLNRRDFIKYCSVTLPIVNKDIFSFDSVLVEDLYKRWNTRIGKKVFIENEVTKEKQFLSPHSLFFTICPHLKNKFSINYKAIIANERKNVAVSINLDQRYTEEKIERILMVVADRFGVNEIYIVRR